VAAFQADIEKYLALREEVSSRRDGAQVSERAKLTRLVICRQEGNVCTCFVAQGNASTSSCCPSLPPSLPPAPQVLSEDSASNVRWLRLDISTLKQQLTSSCDAWVAAFSGLLASLASRQLAALEQELTEHCAALEGQGMQLGGGSQADEPAEKQTIAAEVAGAQGVVPEDGAAAAEESCPAAALTRAQRFEALEALHGRVLGQREALQEQLAVCQERYQALVGLQVGADAWDEKERICSWCARYCTAQC